MSASAWWLFCTLSLITAFTPGPAVLLAVSNATTLGARRALISSLGNATGVFVVAVTALLGLGALLQASSTAFTMLKTAGAMYLVYLGIRQWRSPPPFAADASRSPANGDAWRLFGQGVLVAATNPKSILFFTALLPQFMQPQASPWRQGLLLTVTFAACTVLSHLCYVAAARHLRRWLGGARGRWWQRLSGMLFIGLGLGLLRLRRQAT